ncbi:MAG: hypothetical protein VKK04_07610 [Synechococcales bacterium]|nr:hypothetical protein [Synechococcales bacterium]
MIVQSSEMSNESGGETCREFIVYACPVGDLAQQLEAYFEKSRAIAPNKAHDYMPHCTLTGFFHDQKAAIPTYCTALDQALREARSNQPKPAIAIQGLAFHPQWHGLELASDWIKQLIAHFARQARSASRRDDLRLKDWLHLSLAYGFDERYNEPLQQLALTLVNPAAAVDWELRFYERINSGGDPKSNPGDGTGSPQASQSAMWICHQCWPI